MQSFLSNINEHAPMYGHHISDELDNGPNSPRDMDLELLYNAICHSVKHIEVPFLLQSSSNLYGICDAHDLCLVQQWADHQDSSTRVKVLE